ncbi:hypothetical protein [Rhodoferax mekongensis]|uniref:hypothetical protein n=1 Tax=Rhodoferax mekongensis TaxID=3068341 RepID=UPI0028BE77F5|nr:hypothetical protein [Rhodoferax sp. TBRC 17199]MDT7514736.1 hypothetical protein [Rhodoferax sp. TBRC 17199]
MPSRLNFKISRATRSVLAAFLAVMSLAAHAQDSARIEQLEKEVQAIKQRLSKLEYSQTASPEQKLSMGSEGWKSVSSWRQLRSGMSPNDVRAILGEPGRLNGGDIANWHYANGGEAIFMREKLYRWTEPN